jgi:ABC-2 type transport system ATP-binding protein
MSASEIVSAPIVAHASPSPVLHVRSLGKSYGDQAALSNISFEMHPREVIGLIGPNGAGKTTLIECLAGILLAQEGEVLWHGSPLPVDRRREVMFYLPDGLRPWDDQYVAHVVEFFAAVYARPARHVVEAVHALDLALVLHKRVRTLSKGFARRLMLALALLTPHPVLLMDEPFDGFDLRQTRAVMEMLRRVAGNGRTLFLAIHQLADAERIADRLLLLDDGRLLGAGTLDDLRAKAALPSASLEDIFLALT